MLGASLVASTCTVRRETIAVKATLSFLWRLAAAHYAGGETWEREREREVVVWEEEDQGVGCFKGGQRARLGGPH